MYFYLHQRIGRTLFSFRHVSMPERIKKHRTTLLHHVAELADVSEAHHLDLGAEIKRTLADINRWLGDAPIETTHVRHVRSLPTKSYMVPIVDVRNGNRKKR